MAYVEVSDNEDTAETSKGNDFSCNLWRSLVYPSALEEVYSCLLSCQRIVARPFRTLTGKV